MLFTIHSPEHWVGNSKMCPGSSEYRTRPDHPEGKSLLDFSQPSSRSPTHSWNQCIARHMMLATQLGKSQHVIEFLGFYVPSPLPGSCPALVYPYCEHGDVMRYIQGHLDANRMDIVCFLAVGTLQLPIHHRRFGASRKELLSCTR